MPPRRTVARDPQITVIFVGTAADESQQEIAARAVISVLAEVEQRSKMDDSAASGEVA
jgi:hypothetical protein